MEIPKTVEDVQKRFVDAQVQESLHLDYKDSRALTNNKARSEIAKDVSAFANADGGMIIYGVEEKEHLPTKIDAGTEHGKINREWLENIITSNIAPRLENIQISQITISDSHSIFAVKVPKSFRGPHQERLESKSYYRRYNFKSVAMEDYEIREAYNRRRIVPPLINIDSKVKGGVIELVISNVGDSVARDIKFEIPDSMQWHEETGLPSLLSDGIKILPPNKSLYLLYNSYYELQKNDSDQSMQFEIGVSYFHPERNRRTSEKFSFNLRELAETVQNESDIEVMTRKVVKELKSLVSELEKVGKRLEPLSKLVSPTGLHLSVPTIENLRHIANQDGEIEKMDPRYCSAQVFMEVLEVTSETAGNLAAYFSGRGDAQSIAQIEGTNEEILERFKHYFIWVGVPKPQPHKLFPVQIEPPKTSKSKRRA